MRKTLNKLCATAIAFSFVAGTALSAHASPLMLGVPSAPPAVENDVIDVQYRRDGRRDFRRDGRRDFRGDARRGFDRRGDQAYYRGYRGQRTARPGYRQHNGFWFPAAAFITGAIIGGALSNQQPAVRVGNAHADWCFNRYRSYRVSDNSFQPYNGPRRQCASPYG